jgi:hypothetical protein
MRSALLAVVPAVVMLMLVRYADALRGWMLAPRTPALVAAGIVRGVPLAALVVFGATGIPSHAVATVIVALGPLGGAA